MKVYEKEKKLYDDSETLYKNFKNEEVLKKLTSLIQYNGLFNTLIYLKHKKSTFHEKFLEKLQLKEQDVREANGIRLFEMTEKALELSNWIKKQVKLHSRG